MQLARNAHMASRTPDSCIADVLIVHIVHSTPNRSPRVQVNFCSALDGCVLMSPAEGAEANLLLLHLKHEEERRENLTLIPMLL